MGRGAAKVCAAATPFEVTALKGTRLANDAPMANEAAECQENQHYPAFCLQLLKQGFGGMYGGVQQGVRLLPHPVQVKSAKVAPVIADGHTVWIQHGNHLRNRCGELLHSHASDRLLFAHLAIDACMVCATCSTIHRSAWMMTCTAQLLCMLPLSMTPHSSVQRVHQGQMVALP